MRMAHSDDVDRSEKRQDAGPASGHGDDKADVEKVRALHDFARRMDKLLLRWAQAKQRRPEGGSNNDR